MWNIQLNHRLECPRLQFKDLVEQHPLLSLAKLDPSYFFNLQPCSVQRFRWILNMKCVLLYICTNGQGVKMTSGWLDPHYHRSELTPGSNENTEHGPNVQAKESPGSFIFADYLISQTWCFVLPNQFRCLT